MKTLKIALLGGRDGTWEERKTEKSEWQDKTGHNIDGLPIC